LLDKPPNVLLLSGFDIDDGEEERHDYAAFWLEVGQYISQSIGESVGWLPINSMLHFTNFISFQMNNVKVHVLSGTFWCLK